MADDAPTPSNGMQANKWFVLLPMFVAVLSLASSFFQSVNYARQIDSAQRNVLRSESLRTCRDIIDVFFQFRLKAEELNAMQGQASSNQNDAMRKAELKAFVYKFGAFGTFLANFQDETTRVRYTELTWELLAIAEAAQSATKEVFDKRFAAVDEKFGKLNEDCVKAAQSRLL